MTQYLEVVGWADFQHYKDRDPPWIKLHRTLLDNYEWGRLPDPQKGQLMGLWLLAARHNNKIPNDPAWITARTGSTEPLDLDLLIRAGFLKEWDAETAAGKREDWPTRYISKEIKARVWARDKGVCVACCSDKNVEFDHIIPISSGGVSSEKNVQLLCRKCNRKKRNKLQAAERIAPHVPAIGPADETERRSLEADRRSLEAETEGEERRGDRRTPDHLGELQSVWEAHAGIINRLKFQKHLAPVLDKYGYDTTLRALKYYLTHPEMEPPRFRTPERFAAQCAECVRMTQPLGDAVNQVAMGHAS